jgi:hypothetical protein
MSHKANPDYSTVVFCTVQFQGIHQWAGCPFEEVKYLRDLHRHVFHVKAYKEVFHNDRDVEFIMLKNSITQYLATRFPNSIMGSMSCEMLAEELIEHFGLSQCEVNEDNENGAIVTVRPSVEQAVTEYERLYGHPPN